jgi:DNA-binding protein H-NS
MSNLSAIRKQIALLEAEAERITKREMSAAIAKVKEIMSTFGLTLKDLADGGVGKKRGAARKSKPKRAGAGVAKYADPKTGKTWSGFGRIPDWIAAAKNRDAFLIDKSGQSSSGSAKGTSAAKPAGAKKSTARKAAAKKTSSPRANKAASSAGAGASAKSARAKPATKRAGAKRAARKRAAAPTLDERPGSDSAANSPT